MKNLNLFKIFRTLIKGISKIFLFFVVTIALMIGFWYIHRFDDNVYFPDPLIPDENVFSAFHSGTLWNLKLFVPNDWFYNYDAPEYFWINSVKKQLDSLKPKNDFTVYTLDSQKGMADDTIAKGDFIYTQGRISKTIVNGEETSFYYDKNGIVDRKVTKNPYKTVLQMRNDGLLEVDSIEEKQYENDDSIGFYTKYYHDTLVESFGKNCKREPVWWKCYVKDALTGYLSREYASDGSLKKIVKKNASGAKQVVYSHQCSLERCIENREDSFYKYQHYVQKKENRIVDEKIKAVKYFGPDVEIFSHAITYKYAPDGKLLEKNYLNEKTQEHFKETFTYEDDVEKSWFVKSGKDTLGWVFKKDGILDEFAISLKLLDENKTGFRIVRFVSSPEL